MSLKHFFSRDTALWYTHCMGVRLKKIKPEWALRLGLGLTFLYSGSSLFAHPEQWLGFAPGWFSSAVEGAIPLVFYLRLQGILEIVIGLLFISGFFGTWGLRAASLFASAEFLFVLAFVGLDAITFRDIGLLGAAVTLFIHSFPSSGVSQTPHSEDVVRNL